MKNDERKYRDVHLSFTVSWKYLPGMQPVFHESGVLGSAVEKFTPPPFFSVFDIGVTQPFKSFKNDCKISQNLAEFEMHVIISLNYSLLIPI